MFKTMRFMLATSMLGVLAAPAFSDVLAYFEYECLVDAGCSHSAGVGSEVQFRSEIYPDSMTIGTYQSGDIAKTSLPAPQFVIDFFTSGNLEEPEPMEFYSMLIGAGGSGRGMYKTAWQTGVARTTPLIRFKGGYDVPLLNGVDLQGYQINSVDFELFDLQILDSDRLDGSAVKTHYRFEILGQLVPEPSGVSISLFGIILLLRRRTSARRPQ